MNITISKRTRLIFLLIFSLPILLHVYNPSLKLGAFGLLLGFIGMTISPIILFGTLIYFISKSWK